MSRQWIRQCNLIVSGGSGSQDLGQLRVKFSIKQWSLQAPNMASFRVYNPAPSTVAKLMAKEYTKLDFYAGYESNSGLVFSGELVQTISGHETAVDSYVDLFAHDSQYAYNNARVTKTLSAGYTPQDKLQVALDAFAQYGITLGVNGLDLSQPKYPRGIPLVGMARDIIREVVLSKQGVWSTQMGQIKIAPKSLDIGGDTVVMSASTGLIGWPRQTQDGIEVTSLLNPALQPHVKIQMDPSTIIAAQRDNNPLSQSANEYNDVVLDKQALAAGTYIIFQIDRVGDTRGQEWYDISLCIGQGGSLPPSQTDKGYSDGISIGSD